MKQNQGRLAALLALLLLFGLCACQSPAPEPTPSMAVLTEITAGPSPTARPEEEPFAAPMPSTGADPKGNTESLDENGSYDSMDDVARYIVAYGDLPDNYMTKDEARDLGWNGGSVERYAPGMCIGGDRFSNRKGLLPGASGRIWTECDIDTLGENSRGSKRVVYSNDGLIYYTDDHYESFERIYPEE